MTDLGNKEIFAENLIYYLNKYDKSQKEVADVLKVSTSTFNDWTKAKKYPRIDKIEILANYFGILKSDLIEKRSEEREEMQKNNDIVSDIVLKLRTDIEFFELVKVLHKLEKGKIQSVKQMLQAFL